MKLNEIFKNTSYDDTLFSDESVSTIENAMALENTPQNNLLLPLEGLFGACR